MTLLSQAVRRRVPPAVLVALLLAGAACRRSPSGARLPPRTPVVLVSIDTLRSDRLPAYGYRGVETPALDALARDAIVFDRVYSHYPVTLPSHATILTGLLPPEHGVRNNKGYVLEERFATLAERLKSTGYRTAGIVSSMVLRRQTGIGQGFDLYDDPTEARVEDPTLAFAERRGEASVAKAERWLDALGVNETFFLFLHLFDPHAPYEAPEPFASRYRAQPYDGEVAYTDLLVGRLVDHLKERGLYDRALVVLLSDHGEGLGDHVEQEHGLLLYREALQVPLMVRLPGGARRGERVAGNAGLIDVAPTILALLGLEREKLPGRALLEPQRPKAERALYAETFFGREQYGFAELRSALQGDTHYIEAPRPELFDLGRDPGEKDNLIPRQAVPPRLVRAIAEVGEGIRSTGTVSSEEAEALAALGYIGGAGGDAAAGSALPDPKDKVHLVVDLWANVSLLGKTDSVEPESRVKHLMEELGIQGKSESISRVVAHNLLLAGRASAARDVLQVFSDSSVAETQLTLGKIAAAQGRVPEARRRFERAMALEPESPGPYRDLGILLLSAGDRASARPLLERAVALDPGQAEAWNALGVLRAGLRDGPGAVEAWRRAVEADPGLGDAWFNLAVTLEELGDRAGARQALERYVPLASGADRARAVARLDRLRRGA